MGSLRPEIVLDEAQRLAGDLRELTPVFDERVRSIVARAGFECPYRIYLVGDGDSLHAAHAAEMMFESVAGVSCEPMGALHFLEYGAESMRLDRTDRISVVLVSASGETERVVHCAERALASGAHTLAITGTADSAVARKCDDVLVVGVTDPVRSPGIRTYQASLLGMLLLAARVGTSQSVADEQVRELVELADAVNDTNEALVTCVQPVAAAVASAPAMAVTGSGPNLGTAMFGAAKMIETAGLFAGAQDIEEWCHVERFAYPADMPVVVIAPPGRALRHAARTASKAAGLGRTVIAVADRRDTEFTKYAEYILPVCGPVREEFSPLLYQLFAAHLAGRVGRLLGRTPFAGGR